MIWLKYTYCHTPPSEASLSILDSVYKSLITSSVLSLTLACFSQTAPIRITADLLEAPRKVYHAEVEIPVRPGPLTLTTPQWIPGTHRPTPLVDSITGVVFTANNQTLPWRRDNVNMFEYHLTIPKGVTSLHAHLDLINPGRQTTKLAAFEWEGLLLYPAGIPTAKIAIQPSVTVPSGWGVGTALTPSGGMNRTSATTETHQFAPTAAYRREDWLVRSMALYSCVIGERESDQNCIEQSK